MKAIRNMTRRMATWTAIVFGLAAFAASAATWTDGSGNVWTYSGGTITAVSFETTTLTIPSAINGTAITGFNADVFQGKTRAVRVTIPSSVTAIPANAFLNCSGLRAVTIQGQGLRAIDDCAFMGCGNLLTFTIPDSVTSLGRGVFSGCSAMESVTIGNGVQTLTGVPYYSGSGPYHENTPMDYDANRITLTSNSKYGLFYNCTSLETVNWGSNVHVKEIGNVAFLNCSALKNIVVPDSVMSIGCHAFFGCANLESITIGNGVTEIGRMAFLSLPKLTSVSFGANIVQIGEFAFQNCVNLQNFTLPDTLRTIEFRAFAGCSKALTSVTIPANAAGNETVLGWGVFADCSKLDTITFGDTVKTLPGVPCVNWDKQNGDKCYYEDSRNTTDLDYYDDGISLWPWTMVYGLFYNCTSLTTINWGNGVRKIGNAVFHNCSALESVTIPDTVTSIGCHAFLGCDSLRTVKIGNKVTEIGRMAFRALPNLRTVIFGDKVEHIARQAFQDCVNLQSFELPKTIYKIDFRAFAGCSMALTEVTIPNNEDIYMELGQGVFSCCSNLTTVTFGDSVRTLPGVDYTDKGWTDYYEQEYMDYQTRTDLTGHEEDGLFYSCTSLTTINWGKGIKTIGNIAFLNCSALENVTIPANVSEIGCHAFYGCEMLDTVVVEGSIQEMGRRAFGNCLELRWVYFKGASMDSEPGEEVFAFDSDTVTAYVAQGSTGWTGLVGVSGLPASRMWSGAHIAYGPPPSDAGTSKVKFDKQGGTGGTASVRATYGAAMPAITVPTKTDFIFGGYYTEVGGKGTQYYTATGASARNWDRTSDTTLYAKWTANGKDLALMTGGDTANWPTPVFLTSSVSSTTPQTTFLQYEPIYFNVSYGNAGNVAISGTSFIIRHVVLDLSADYEPIATRDYSVAPYIAPGATRYWHGELWSGLQNLPPGDYVYGVLLDKKFNVNEVDEDNNYLPYADFSIVKGLFTMTFDSQDGSGGTASVTATYGLAMPTITVPTRTGYAFGGYWTEPNGGGTQYYTAAGTSAHICDFKSAKTLYAYWMVPQTIFRFYSPNYKGHFFTIDEDEAENIKRTNTKNWKYEGVAYKAYPQQAAGTVALHRFYSKNYKGHFFTIDEDEAENIKRTNAKNWKYEGVAYYVYPSAVEGSVPVFRFWSKRYRHHFYTINEAEKDSLIAGNPNWKFEGTAFWALPAQGAGAEAESFASDIRDRNDTSDTNDMIDKNGTCDIIETCDTIETFNGNGTCGTDGETDIAVAPWTLVAWPEFELVALEGETYVGDAIVEASADAPDAAVLGGAGDEALVSDLPLLLSLPDGEWRVMLWNATDGMVADGDAIGIFGFTLPANGAWHWLCVRGADDGDAFSLWLRAK